MKRLVTILALLTSIGSFVVIAGGGLALLAIENSGERGVGALLAFCSFVALAAVFALVIAREGVFGEGVGRAAAIGIAIVGAIPPAALAFVAIRFAGLPIDSRIPLVDWTVLVVGILLALGALSILALGHRRSQEAVAPMIHMQQIRHAQQQLRSAFEADQSAAPGTDTDDDDIRVRRV